MYAALHVCHPPGTPPAWLTARGPRCATGAAVDIDQEHAEELADLVAMAWWECLQDDPSETFAVIFAAACEVYLHPPPQPSTVGSVTPRADQNGNRPCSVTGNR
ncbi:hypothetical protein GCM10010371_25160 [Streptomyces subrutilus]|uniref:Uncharacterized protein n=1 Tax=Streptomyces subrutilus TaxID=36818 RepID=A0A5P2UF24_9ACTN|nr:hypothetical protein [Streptomyces subrutilus]QEU77598.1 hypothetical protein CP968_04240 [Streptomyces subrutilus]GGZ64521.1 hypothetical protein GCM10010371_25160 [Streptomyces subrutilus]